MLLVVQHSLRLLLPMVSLGAEEPAKENDTTSDILNCQNVLHLGLIW